MTAQHPTPDRSRAPYYCDEKLRFISCDDTGTPTTRDIPLYTLARILAEHRRHLTRLGRAA